MRKVFLIGCCRIGLEAVILKNCNDFVFIDEFVLKTESDFIPIYSFLHAEREETILFESTPSKFIGKPKNNFKIR